MGEPIQERIRQLLAEGKPKRLIAQELGISPTTLYKYMADMKDAIAYRAVAGPIARPMKAADADRAVARQLDTLEQLAQANSKTWEMVERLEALAQEKSLNPRLAEVILKGLGEVRAQVETQAKLMEMLYSMQEVREFQRIVLDVINEVAPDAAAEIRRRIGQRQALRGLSA